jgi:hypothetical protein
MAQQSIYRKCSYCEHWDSDGEIRYEAGAMATCNELSGNKHPYEKGTLVYTSAKNQRIFTRASFLCNQFRPKQKN